MIILNIVDRTIFVFVDRFELRRLEVKLEGWDILTTQLPSV